ncbi:zinc metalloproteinase nas-14 [Pholidichthys leucotaenia]
MSCCIMWLLVLTFIASGCAVPISPAQNATSPTTGAALSSVPDPSEMESAEIIEGLEDKKPVEEGDILIQEDRSGILSVWPDATMAYTINEKLAHRRKDIQAAFKMISKSTCIRFKKHTTEYSYLEFDSGSGCSSFIGCRGGHQSLYIAESCGVGNICHEIGHALGLRHEHTRTDRDQHVTVNWANIMPGRETNFKIKSENTPILKYDFDSIMHYGPYFFSKNGSPTLSAKNSDVKIGQRTHLSKLDAERLNKLYHCKERMAERATG